MAAKAKARGQAALPARYEPQLATLVKQAPPGDAWLHELKYDGYRIGCRIDGPDVSLLSRRGKDWTASFPEVCAAARRLATRRALIDGEVAVVLPDGRTSFQALQNFFGGERGGLSYFAFDLLHLDGTDLTGQPLEERKRALETLVGAGGLIRYSAHVIGGGAAFLASACQMGLEGIVSKQRALAYQSGRTTGWLKSKCTKSQELVIGGFTDPEGQRQGIGALLVGVYDAGGRLVFAGKVGTGFSERSARDLRQRLEALEQKSPPFDPPPQGWLRGHAHWVRPTLVAAVNFAEWTGDGKVRHASFQGLRADKPAREVVAEMPVAPPAAAPASPAARARARPLARGAAAAEVAGVAITHPDRVLYPATGLTKLGLAQFYASIAGAVLPHVLGRPLTLVRCPKGLTGPGDGEGCSYMKHSNVWAPPALRRVRIRERTKTGEYLVVEDLAGVVALVQMDILEIHTWSSRADAVERPDRVVFDLDPGPEVPWTAVIEAAHAVRQALASLELDSFVKTTGGVGLHVVVPLFPDRSWDDCLTFSRGLATALAARSPGRYTVALARTGREKQIFIDYLRNNRANTSVAAFSTRARASAPVSVPLAWEELSPRLTSDHFTVATVPARLQRQRRDPWHDYWRCRQRLTNAILEAVARV
jgi:bifunctional non-homologous end joining protein LigD